MSDPRPFQSTLNQPSVWGLGDEANEWVGSNPSQGVCEKKRKKSFYNWGRCIGRFIILLGGWVVLVLTSCYRYYSLYYISSHSSLTLLSSLAQPLWIWYPDWFAAHRTHQTIGSGCFLHNNQQQVCWAWGCWFPTHHLGHSNCNLLAPYQQGFTNGSTAQFTLWVSHLTQ